MRKNAIAVLSLILTLLLLTSGCGQAAKNSANGKGNLTGSSQTKILRVNNTDEPGSLHPAKAESNLDSWVLDHIFEGLTKKDASGSIVPGIAKDWQITDYGMTYTFNLRTDAKWTNGDPVTAADFEYAWKYVLNPATKSSYAYMLYPLAGAEAYNTADIGKLDAAKLKELEDKVGVKALDEKTLQVKLVRPAPYFLEMLSFYTYYPINKKVQEANKDWATNASTYVSNGAFKLTEWRHKESIKIEKNQNYYDKDKIKLDAITFAMIGDSNTAWQMYKSGDLDIAYPMPPDVTAQLIKDNNPELRIDNVLATYFYRFNTTRKPFNNIKVRKALAMAIDRESLVKDVTQGGQKPAFTLVPPGIPDSDGKTDFQRNADQVFKEDAAEAKRLLAEGLAEEGMDKFSFTLTYNNDVGNRRIAEAVQQMWKTNLNIDVKLEGMEPQVVYQREAALDYDVVSSGWMGDYIDPMTFLDMFLSDSTMNDTGWKNADYDRFIKIAQASNDPAQRMQNLHEAEKLLISEMPVAPIYFYTAPYAVKPYVTGIYKPVNRCPQFHYVDIKK